MKKFKLGVSFVLIILTCIICKNVLMLFNYLLALMFHELAHLFVASRRGYKLKVVKLNMCGLSIELDEQVKDKDSFAINIAGPLVNLFIAILCVAMYWLVPKSFYYLNVFCLSNIVLAIFNLIPVYPLDGGKIFSGIIKNKKVYKNLDLIIRIILSFTFFSMFIFSLNGSINWFFLVFSLFFLLPNQKKETTFSLFKFKSKDIEKVELLKVNETDEIFTLLKKIKNTKYTIFYCPNLKNQFIDEDRLIYLATRMPLTAQIKNIDN